MSKPVSSPTDSISQVIDRLRALSQVSIQTGWRYCDRDLPIEQALDPATWNTWTIGTLNAKDHLPWLKGGEVCWFSQTIIVPTDLNGYPLEGLTLRLALLWWAQDAQVFVDGQLVQEGDLFDCAPRLRLRSSAKPGDEIAIALRLVSPNHEDGALMKSVCHYETPPCRDAINPVSTHLPEPSFIANELSVLHSFLQAFQPDQLETLATALSQIDWSPLSHLPISPSSHPPISSSLNTLRHQLLPLAQPIKQRQIKLLGHAHLDMAWLWTVDETWKAAERTFKSVLSLQNDFPELIFCHSTPALYEWIEQNRPDLFTQIQQQVQAGKWEIVAGFWIEPELNLINGESMVRQVLYGQRYVQEKFGEICPIAWVPDTFGFTWQLPQILKHGGVDYFVTQKLRWNDTTQFPHALFNWQAPDGTQILSLMSAQIGEGIDPVKMATFAWEFEQKTGLQTSLWLPGVGDHGGGPTRDMLEVARRWQQSPFFPQLEFGTAVEYLRGIRGQEVEGKRQEARGKRQDRANERIGETGNETGAPQSKIQNSKSKISEPHSPFPTPHSLPIWNSELYLEFHRGCYTTHADQKTFNRRSEELLYEAELWASLATIATDTAYPKAELEAAWKKVLFNQFHDILPGSSITEVYEEANKTWEEAKQIGLDILRRSLEAIAQQIALPPPPHPEAQLVVVFNPLNWERSQTVTVATWQEASAGKIYHWQVCDLEGQAVEVQQCSQPPATYCKLLTFKAENVPGVGYRCFWLIPHESRPPIPQPAPNHSEAEPLVLENEFLRVIVDPETGDLSSVFDKTHQREVLSGPGNQLQAFEDEGQYWDAWNIDPNYAQHPLPPAELLSISYRGVSKTSQDQRVSVMRTVGEGSKFFQTYILRHGSQILEIDTVDVWFERHVLVKAAFPLNVQADVATYEIPCGAITRPTQPQTDAERAKWEVSALHWADLSDGKYGVSLLNSNKYGYDCQNSLLRLTLLRRTEWPDPNADLHTPGCRYALYSHAGGWQLGDTVRHGYEFNQSLHTVRLPANHYSTSGTLPPSGQFLHLNASNLILMAFKQSEDSPDEWILRCYECHGETAQLTLHSDVLDLKLECAVDGLERPLDAPNIEGQTVTVRPWEIASFKVSVR